MPGVRAVPDEELGRRQRAVDLIRSGTSECPLLMHCFTMMPPECLCVVATNDICFIVCKAAVFKQCLLWLD